ncbi:MULTISPECIES: ABC transporter permease subunit [unclassified Aminobacter]|uniref:ABC transporter permease n=1 Tax=unclassified Aminobacter TaxID=2644704 RepID=UPI000A018666|nr:MULTISPECIES: ABC transporter permease subunit [unclassified Aminobacter]
MVRPTPSVPGAAIIVATVAWLGSAAITRLWPNATEDWYYTEELFYLKAAVAAVLLALAIVPGLARPKRRARHSAPWLIVLAVVFAVWEIVTAKIPLLPRPFFAPPQGLLEVYIDDWPRLVECVIASFLLLATGYLIGAVTGFITGVAIGWSKIMGYWIHPVLRLIGPLPPVAWLPVAFFTFPSSWGASIFLIALATAVPVTILTWSGVSSVNSSLYDVARTMGASRWFLVLRVAIPAAMPHVYVGLFMGMAASFAVLVVAEMMGVKAGLGWYLQWALGWAAYANMYAALLILALLCSGLVTLLFKIRDRHLAWQKGLMKW